MAVIKSHAFPGDSVSVCAFAGDVPWYVIEGKEELSGKAVRVIFARQDLESLISESQALLAADSVLTEEEKPAIA